jgi:hypothetical protein
MTLHPIPSKSSFFNSLLSLLILSPSIQPWGELKIGWSSQESVLDFKCKGAFKTQKRKILAYKERKVTVSMTGSSPLFFHFDTHIITQMNREVGLTFFDKVSSPGETTSYCTSPRDFSMYNVDFYPKLYSQTFLHYTCFCTMNTSDTSHIHCK